MSEQLGLDLEDAPKGKRRGALRSFHARSHVPVAEALAGENRANRQDALVLAVFRALPGRRLTPSDVEYELAQREPPPIPLLTSIRRSLTNLTNRGLLAHDARDRRPGPRGSSESTWSLAG